MRFERLAAVLTELRPAADAVVLDTAALSAVTPWKFAALLVGSAWIIGVLFLACSDVLSYAYAPPEEGEFATHRVEFAQIRHFTRLMVGLALVVAALLGRWIVVERAARERVAAELFRDRVTLVSRMLNDPRTVVTLESQGGTPSVLFRLERTASRIDSVRVLGRLLVTHVPAAEDSARIRLETARALDQIGATMGLAAP